MKKQNKKKAQRYNNIFLLIKEYRPKTILEIGTYNGVNAIKMTKLAKQFNDNVFYYGFDLFEEITPEIREYEFHGKKLEPTYQQVCRILDECKCEYQLIKGNTKNTLLKFVPNKPIDFIFIDGGHSVDTITQDWNNVKKFLHSNTVVLFDDYYLNHKHVGCHVLIDYLKTNPRYHVTNLLPIDNIYTSNKILIKVQVVKVTLTQN